MYNYVYIFIYYTMALQLCDSVAVRHDPTENNLFNRDDLQETNLRPLARSHCHRLFLVASLFLTCWKRFRIAT